VILAVDDSTDLLALMAKALAAEYRVLTAADAGTALELAAGEPRPDLILLDVEMPGASGFDLARVLKSEGGTADIPLIFLTGKTDPKDQAEGFALGAVDYVTKPINSTVLKARVRTHLALSNRRHELERLVKERTALLERTRLEVIRRLARAMELHESAAVGNRVMRLGQYAKLVSQAAGAKPEICELMLHAAPLHDVGKLGVPAEILRKRDQLSVPDWERVRRHPGLGAEIIGEHDDPLLKLARQVALTHHEHWDGSGYPQGLKGEAIPWGGRVMAIVDAFESMTTTQFYRDALPIEKAAAEIAAGAGKAFDPKLVEAFHKALPVMRKVRAAYSDELGDMINLDFAHGAPEKPAARKPPPAAAQPAARPAAAPKPGAQAKAPAQAVKPAK
jgi:putative two-component system response regulator